ncbi:MAG TPA: hypothetical protein PLO23_11825 [Alphaproteobacteria bacterium]|nr:hypothetical protein [Alphaproteobacteria bacterium]
MLRGVFELLSGAAKTFYGEFTKAGSQQESFYRPVPGLGSRGVVLPKGEADSKVLDAPDLNTLRDLIRAGKAGAPRAIREVPDFGKTKGGKDTGASVVPDLNKLREMVMATQAVAAPRSTDHLFAAKPGIDYGGGRRDEGREDRGPQWIESEWEP